MRLDEATHLGRARGAKSNASGRFEAFTREDFNDGWDREEDDPPELKTELQVAKARKIIAPNDSPDMGFNSSVNPYRGCEHGCIYPPVAHLPGRPSRGAQGRRVDAAAARSP